MATVEQAAVYLAQEMHQGMEAPSGNGAGNISSHPLAGEFKK